MISALRPHLRAPAPQAPQALRWLRKSARRSPRPSPGKKPAFEHGMYGSTMTFVARDHRKERGYKGYAWISI